MIPPDANGEFVAHMEDVLETYEKAHDPDCPVVCRNEQPVQLIGETRVPIPATKELRDPRRGGYEATTYTDRSTGKFHTDTTLAPGPYPVVVQSEKHAVAWRGRPGQQARRAAICS